MRKYHLYTVALVAGSVMFWAVGIQTGAVLALVAGGVLELIVWKRVLTGRNA